MTVDIQSRAFIVVAALGLFACGGTVVFEEDGGAGASDGGGGSTSSSPSTTSASSTATATSANSSATATAATAGGSFPETVAVSASSGTTFCTSHEECGPGNVCVFRTGECARECDPNACDSCGPGFVCDGCASSSCPKCADCVSACVPTPEGRCDDDDACGAGLACNYFTTFCEEACNPDGTCATPGKFCDPCATSSCCACDSCSGLCIFGED